MFTFLRQMFTASLDTARRILLGPPLEEIRLVRTLRELSEIVKRIEEHGHV